MLPTKNVAVLVTTEARAYSNTGKKETSLGPRPKTNLSMDWLSVSHVGSNIRGLGRGDETRKEHRRKANGVWVTGE